MTPLLLGLPPWHLCWSVAALLGTVINVVALRARGLPGGRVALVLLTASLMALLGAKVEFALENSVPLSAWLDPAGFRMPGALVALAVTMPALLWMLRLPVLTVLDTIAPAVAFTIFVGRFGCFLQGCCYGEPTSLPWGVRYPAESRAFMNHFRRDLVPSDATLSLPVHPLALYFAFDGLAIAAVLLWLARRQRYTGQIALSFLALRGWSKVALEQLRAQEIGTTVNHSGAVEAWLGAAATLALVILALRRGGAEPR